MKFNDSNVKEAVIMLGYGGIKDDGTAMRDLILGMKACTDGQESEKEKNHILKVFGIEDKNLTTMTEFAEILAEQVTDKYGRAFFGYYPEIRRRVAVDDTKCDFLFICQTGKGGLHVLIDDLRNREDRDAWYLVDSLIPRKAFTYFDACRQKELDALNVFNSGVNLLSEDVFEQFGLKYRDADVDGTFELLKSFEDLLTAPSVVKLNRIDEVVQTAAYECGSLYGDDNFNEYYEREGVRQNNSSADLYYAMLHGIDRLKEMKEKVYANE